MFKNYLKVAFRNLYKYKGFSLINICGLAIGMTCALLILLYVQFELSFDKHFDDAGRIYRVAWIYDNPQTRTPHPMAQAMVRDFPEVEQAVSLTPLWGPALTRPKRMVKYGDRRFDEAEIYSADSTFFEVFSFNFIEGDPKTALKQFGGIVITEEIAHKYFGEEPALGKMLTFDFGQDADLQVTGVIENVPQNTHFHFDFLLSYVTQKPFETGSFFEWEDFGHYNYVRLAPGADSRALEKKLLTWVAGYTGWPETLLNTLVEHNNHFDLQPITAIHLHSHLKWELEPNGDITYVMLFITAAIFILLIACINFMNLTTARSANRAKEVGVRKVIGAGKFQLVQQFLGEALLISIFAIIIAAIAVEITLPVFNNLTGQVLSVDYSLNNWVLWSLPGTAVLAGLIAGSYPAFYLSAFRPVKVLKGTLASETSGYAPLRKALVVFQFAISIALISATGIVASQLSYLHNKNLGFDKAQIVVAPIKSPQMRGQLESVKAALLKNSTIIAVSAASNVPGSRFNQNPVSWPGDPDRSASMSQLRVDYDFFETLGAKFAAGRSFSRDYRTDLTDAFILNETAARQFTWDNPIDEELVWEDDDDLRRGKVIGVVQDFHFQSLRTKIEPLIIQLQPQSASYLLVKITGTIQKSISAVQDTWQSFDPGHTFEYSFLDQDFDNLYRAEERMQAIFGYFAALTVFIAALGLFGLVSFAAQQRTREIGIRKVLGASVTNVVELISKEYLRLVLLANLVAWPIAYLVMQGWLQAFAYHTPVHWWHFIFAGLLTLIIALVTVSTQAIRAGMINPVQALRHE